jgi:hypothetical protein
MKYLSITLAVIVVALLLPLSLKGCAVTVPTPPNQTASQTAHCMGLIVSHSCNQAIYQGTPPPTDVKGILDAATVLIALLAGIGLALYVALSIAFRRREP